MNQFNLINWCENELCNPDKEVVFTIDDPFGQDTTLKFRIRTLSHKILVTETQTDYRNAGSGTASFYIDNLENWLTQKFKEISPVIKNSELGYFTVRSLSLTVPSKPNETREFKFTPELVCCGSFTV